MKIRAFAASDQEAVIDLWRRCALVRAWNDPAKDIRRKLEIQRDLFLVGLEEETIVATVMAGYEGHRGWVNYLAVHPERQGRGLGRVLMAEVEARLAEIGCPKINLQVRAENEGVISFYRALGYQIDEVTSLGKRLEDDEF